jgi:hypothetical protein
MRNPLRSEAEAFRFLVVTLVVAIVIGVASWINTWVGVAAAVVAIGAVFGWMRRASPEVDTPSQLVSATPGAEHRVLLVAPSGTTALPDGLGAHATDVLVVVPALVSTVHALTGAVDDERAQAERTAEALAGALGRTGVPARGGVGADDTVLAIEDALREYGADEIVFVAGDNGVVDQARERFALPVTVL